MANKNSGNSKPSGKTQGSIKIIRGSSGVGSNPKPTSASPGVPSSTKNK